MKKRSFIAGMLTMLLIMTLVVPAAATVGKVTKELEYRDISVTLDGVKLDLKDAKGNPVEPFMFEGTNYLPVRALAEALGLKVSWDSKNATVVLETPSKTVDTSAVSASKQGAVYSGNGDDVITIAPMDYAYAIYIEGNSAGRHFSVTSYDKNNNYLDLLVNTSAPYSGTVLDPTLTTTTLEINATGAWTITFVPLNQYPVATSGQTVHGTGDEVFLFDGTSTTAHITGNAAGRHFSVWAYSPSESDLVVNTSNSYSGTVKLPSNTTIIEVKATGAWSIDMN